MSDMINNGGPAFPLGPTAGTMKPTPDGTLIVTHYGMESGLTIRDYFAAAALQGLLAGYLHRAKLDEEGALMVPKSMHAVAYNCADEMLWAREAKP